MITYFIKHIVASLFAFSILALSIVISLFITNFFYHQIGWKPNEITFQIVNFTFTLMVLGGISYVASPITRQFRREGQADILDPINKALQQLAMGDFDIELDAGSFPNSPVGKIIHDINFAATELSKLETMRQEFISNVSHEIQSPLTSINGFAKALKDFELTDEERHRYLCIIEQESDRLSKISANLLKLTALESEQQTVERTPYALDKQLIDCVISCEPHWLEKKIEIDIDLAKIEIEADQDLMSQVWINLISNSIKFTPEGGIIRVKATIKDQAAMVEIEDSGVGLSEIEQERIFERFYKADQSRTVSKGGSGLGLAIVKKIIELHHGQIAVESQLGKGTKFTLIIPLTSSDLSTES